MDDVADVVKDSLLLSNFIVEGHVERCERFENSSDVNFRSTCNTNTEIRKVQTNKLLHEIKDLFSCGWKSRCIGTFVDRVKNDVPHRCMRKSENFLQTIDE